jgi:predicted RNA-binding protein with PIN domain|uniref:NYN domain-containing protein n=1 Tax=candidate division WOR-3 bacterium TaxID=2052148 RepID=A0A7V5XYW9_UNCW3
MYLIDGYNLLYQFAKDLKREEINEKRERLILLIKDYCEKRKKRCWLFFDVKSIPLALLPQKNQKSQYLKISYTKDADLAIINLLENTKDITKYTVVSSDRKICDYAQKRGFRVLNSQKFKNLLIDFLKGISKIE